MRRHEYKVVLLGLICFVCGITTVFFHTNLKPVKSSAVSTSMRKQQADDDSILVVGSGFSGAVIAHLHATLLGKKVLVVEKNSHIGGSCFDYVNKHGIRVSKYGLHVLHTNNELVWRFMSQFTKWIPYEHRVVAKIDDNYVPIPPNIDTVNALFNLSITNSVDMKKWLKDHTSRKNDNKKGIQPEMNDLFSKTFEYSSPKGCFSSPRSNSMPIRDDFDDRCFPDDVHQVLPADGYTSLINQMLDHPLITVKLNVQFNPKTNNYSFSKTFYTGPIDTYFESSGQKKLAYHYVSFKTNHLKETLFQPSIVVDYPQNKHYLRIVEYKHLASKTTLGTTIVKQTFVNNGYPYYPVNDEYNNILYNKYEKLAKEEERRSKVYFVGGLARYQYFNIDQTVMNAIVQFRRAYPDQTISFTDKNSLPKSSSNIRNYLNSGKPSITFITNHCKESLAWIPNGIPLCSENKINIVIYEKCNQMKIGSEIRVKYPKCNIHQIELPNIGREGHSWLYHMMTNQFLFSDINVFVQGGKEVAYNVLVNTIDDKKLIENIKSPLYFKTPSDKFAAHYSPFGNTFVCFDLRYKYQEWTAKMILERTCNYFYLITRSNNNCSKFMVNNRGEFVVTGALLHRTVARHKNVLFRWYKDLSTGNNPITGHIIERLWTLLFQYPIIPKC